MERVMARGNTGNAGKGSPLAPSSPADNTQAGVAAGVDGGLAIVEGTVAKNLGAAAIGAVEAARGLR